MLPDHLPALNASHLLLFYSCIYFFYAGMNRQGSEGGGVRLGQGSPEAPGTSKSGTKTPAAGEKEA